MSSGRVPNEDVVRERIIAACASNRPTEVQPNLDPPLTPEPLAHIMFFRCDMYKRFFFHACARVLRDYFGEPRQLSWCGDYVTGRTKRNSSTNPSWRKRIFSFLQSFHTSSGARPALSWMWKDGYSLEVKRSKLKAEHSSPSGVEFRNPWRYMHFPVCPNCVLFICATGRFNVWIQGPESFLASY